MGRTATTGRTGAPRAAASTTRTSRKTLESFDPATGERLGSVPVTPPRDVERVAEEVARIQQGWALTPLTERLRVIGRAAQVLLRRRDEVALAITRENGQTVMESLATGVIVTALNLDWVARWGHRYLAPERLPHPVQLPVWQKRHWVVYRPLGVIGVIGPWNYPLSIPMGAAAFALAGGNGVVIKPSELTPLVAEEIVRLFEEAGLPTGLVRVVHGGGETGAALCKAGPVRKISFTGGTATGRKVMELAARHGKPVTLELGGKDPAIVCADADLYRAVAGTLWGACCSAGQTCVSVERVYVDRRVHDEYLGRLVEAAKRIRPGDPKDPGTQIGPIVSEAQYEKVVGQLEDAVAAGAAVQCGGPEEVPGLAGRFIAPAVLTGVDHSMTVMREETFGPLIPVMPFETEQEALRLANDSAYGLGASVWSRDVRRAGMLAERLEAGMIWINDVAYSHAAAHTPWAGVKDSGTGLQHSRFALHDMVEKRLVGEDAGRFPVGWWYPYDEVKRRGLAALIESLYTPGLARRAEVLRRRWPELRGFVRSLLGGG